MPGAAPTLSLLCFGADDTAAFARTSRSVAAARRSCEIVPVTDQPLGDAIAAARGQWVAVVDAGDEIDPLVVDMLRSELSRAPTTDVVYTDEDERHGRERLLPFFKPAWSPDRLRCQPYVGRLALVRRALVDAAARRPRERSVPLDELELWLSASTVARRVAHVPRVLYHRTDGVMHPYPRFASDDLERAAELVQAHLDRARAPGVVTRHRSADGLLEVRPRLDRRPAVSVIVPSGATRRMVRGTECCLVVNCVRSIVERSTYEDLEIVIVLDRDVDETVRTELSNLDPRVRITDFEGPFHFARKINYGALQSEGEVLVLLNDDTEVESVDWVERMLVHALEREVGAVGARLLFGDDRIQHAGVVAVRGNPGHPYYGSARDTAGYGGNALVPGNFLAVTAACLMTRRESFVEVGGLSAMFPVNYNDLDYCLKLFTRGYRIVCTPWAVLHHYESSSRSGDVEELELRRIRARWGRLLFDDPYYGPNFPSGNADFVPATVAAVTTP